MDTVVANPGVRAPSSGKSGGVDAARTSVRSVEVVWYVAVLALAAAAGLVNLYRPLYGDSALFLLTAEGMSRGHVLYVDVWDNKQPGIFAFCYVAGRLFGFTEPGLRLFELCWMLAFSALLCAALRPCLRWRWLSGVAPLAFVSTYYFQTEPQHLLQVEGLVALPIFASAWLLARDWQSVGGRSVGYLLAGIAAATAVVFKLALALLFVAFVLLATVEQLRRCRPARPAAFVARLWVSFTAGVGVALGAVVGGFWIAGALPQLLWTTFAYPELAAGEMARGLIEVAPVHRLVSAFAWYAAVFAPWLPFAAVAAAHGFRRGEPALIRLMLLWLIVGVAIIIAQRFSWWPYHMMLLFAPMAVIAARGVDIAAAWLLSSRGLSLPGWQGPAAAAVFLVLPALSAVAVPVGDRISSVLPVLAGGDDRASRVATYQMQHSEIYRRLAPVAEVVRAPDSLPGDIYVFGDPLIYLFSGRHQALPVHGWSWQMFVEPQWQRLPEDLLSRRPVYVFITPFFDGLIAQRNPRVLEVIKANYVVHQRSDEGTWYRLTQPAA